MYCINMPSVELKLAITPSLTAHMGRRPDSGPSPAYSPQHRPAHPD